MLLFCLLAFAMTALWKDILHNEQLIQDVAAIAVDAALLEGVLMRTEEDSNVSDVSIELMWLDDSTLLL